MADIYTQFDAAFANVSAYDILRDGKPVARAVIKHGARLTFYLQAWGCEMVRGTASGGGYDRATAAAYGAARKLAIVAEHELHESGIVARGLACAISSDGGRDWKAQIEACGFLVQHVI